MPEPVPAVDEDAVHPVAGHDLPLHLGHELEVVGAEAAGDPHLRRGPVAARLAVRVHRDPVGVRRLHVVVGRVRVGAGDDDHAEPAAAGDQLAEHVAVAEPRAAVVEGDLRSGSRRRSRRRSGRRRRSACAGSSRARTATSNFAGSSSTSVSCAQRMGRSIHEGAGGRSSSAATAVSADERGARPPRPTAAPASADVFRNWRRGGAGGTSGSAGFIDRDYEPARPVLRLVSPVGE